MSRKESVTHTYLRDKAFEMTRTKGISEVTARKLAAFAGCSTQPIFRNYENMAACYDEVFEDSLSFFDGFYNDFYKGSHDPFVNLGLCYIQFAQKEPHIFSYLFMTKNDRGYNLYNLLNGRTGAVLAEMNMAKSEGVKSPEQIFMKMWMLIHGAACMAITGDFDLTEAQTRLQLEDSYKAFIR